MQTEGIIKRMVLDAVSACNSCGHGYELDDVDALGHAEGLWFFLLNCAECHSQGLVAAVVKDENGEETAAETAEELDEDASVEVLELPPDLGLVTADDVLDLHQFLKDFDGDFRQLFGE